ELNPLGFDFTSVTVTSILEPFVICTSEFPNCRVVEPTSVRFTLPITSPLPEVVAEVLPVASKYTPFTASVVRLLLSVSVPPTLPFVLRVTALLIVRLLKAVDEDPPIVWALLPLNTTVLGEPALKVPLLV